MPALRRRAAESLAEGMLTAKDGYVRRSPVQPIHEAADYRSRLLRRGVGAVLLLAAVCAGVILLFRLGIFAW